MKIIPIIDEASPLMTNVCPLTDGVQAFRDLENNRDGKMKGVPRKPSVVRNEPDGGGIPLKALRYLGPGRQSRRWHNPHRKRSS
jgi:hypothetical protein